MKKLVVSLNLTRCFPKDLTFARSVATAMSDNLYFPAPSPSIATLEADIEVANLAEVAVLTAGKGAAQERNGKFAVVHGDLLCLRAYVEKIANELPVEEGIVAVTSSGMFVKRVGHYDKPILAARLGPLPGIVILLAKAQGDRAWYEWQYSQDQATWLSPPMTGKARTTLTGLTPKTTYFFRLRCLTTHGKTDFSDVVSLFVL